MAVPGPLRSARFFPLWALLCLNNKRPTFSSDSLSVQDPLLRGKHMCPDVSPRKPTVSRQATRRTHLPAHGVRLKDENGLVTRGSYFPSSVRYKGAKSEQPRPECHRRRRGGCCFHGAGTAACVREAGRALASLRPVGTALLRAAALGCPPLSMGVFGKFGPSYTHAGQIVFRPAIFSQRVVRLFNTCDPYFPLDCQKVTAAHPTTAVQCE